jgi:hypothetical protein
VCECVCLSCKAVAESVCVSMCEGWVGDTCICVCVSVQLEMDFS